ncbi:MAG: helix-turn-helix transcriptional regulator [Acidimicrobiia bacterium]
MVASNRDEVRDFLTSRRARISPQQAGLVSFGRRRVPGLRREEVATLAGVSVDYLSRLERGNLTGVSDGVIEAIARALQLDDAERAHLFDLARAANSSPTRRAARPAPRGLRVGIQQLLDAMTDAAALVGNARGDTLGANRLGRALFGPMIEGPARGNGARFVFLDPRSVDFYPEWSQAAHSVVAALRSEAARNPDTDLTALIGELATYSDAFRTLWATHDVRLHRTGSKRIHHPVVGDLTLAYDVLGLPADEGLEVVAFTAEPGSTSADALKVLASWAASATEKSQATGPTS